MSRKLVKFKVVNIEYEISEMEGFKYAVAGRKCFVSKDSIFEYSLTDAETGCRITSDYTFNMLITKGINNIKNFPERFEKMKAELKSKKIEIPVNP